METNFCGECGATMASKNAKICVKCGADPKRTENYCSSCGEKLKSKNATICLKCGSSLGGGGFSSLGPKDPAMAALISVVGLLLFQAPAIGYMYLGNVKKGLVYLIAGWLLWVVIGVVYILGAMTYVGIFCCAPLLLLPFIFEFVIVYDVYLEAKGEKTMLPAIVS